MIIYSEVLEAENLISENRIALPVPAWVSTDIFNQISINTKHNHKLQTPLKVKVTQLTTE